MSVNRYVDFGPSGKRTRYAIPRVWDPQEVAARLGQHVVFLLLRRKETVWLFDGRPQTGGVVCVHAGRYYYVPGSPADDAECYRLWSEYVSANL